MNAASRMLVVCAVLFAAGPVAGAEGAMSGDEGSGEPVTVEGIIASLKEPGALSMSFEETIYSSLLVKPLSARGVLRFMPPSRLEKEVRDPYRERYIVEGNQVIYENERRHVAKTISLEEYPGLRGFVDAFRAVLSGDAAQLKRAYETSIEGTWRRWAVLLRPRDRAAQTIVESIQISGTERRIDTMTIRVPDGDHTVMTLVPEPAP